MWASLFNNQDQTYYLLNQPGWMSNQPVLPFGQQPGLILNQPSEVTFSQQPGMMFSQQGPIRNEPDETQAKRERYLQQYRQGRDLVRAAREGLVHLRFEESGFVTEDLAELRDRVYLDTLADELSDYEIQLNNRSKKRKGGSAIKKQGNQGDQPTLRGLLAKTSGNQPLLPTVTSGGQQVHSTVTIAPQTSNQPIKPSPWDKTNRKETPATAVQRKWREFQDKIEKQQKMAKNFQNKVNERRRVRIAQAASSNQAKSTKQLPTNPFYIPLTAPPNSPIPMTAPLPGKRPAPPPSQRENLVINLETEEVEMEETDKFKQEESGETKAKRSKSVSPGRRLRSSDFF